MYVKCSEDSERKKRKSPFNDHTLIWRNDTPFPGNPREYLHKPYIATNYDPCSMGYIFAADSMGLSSFKF